MSSENLLGIAIFRYALMSSIGARIKAAAERVGGLNKLANLVGIPRRTLGDKISGRSPIEVPLLVKIAEATGTSLDELAGLSSRAQSQMQTQSARASTPAPTAALVAVGEIVIRLHRAAGIKLSESAIVSEVARHLEAILARVVDPNDIRELETQLPWLEYSITKELQSAAAAPGTGKREAS